MQPMLLAIPLKHGKLAAYKAFVAEITGPKKREYSDLLKRYGLTSVTVWYHKIGGKEYAMVLHNTKGDASERLKHWPSSTHPFDVWFREQLANCYEGAPEEGHLLFSFEPQH